MAGFDATSWRARIEAVLPMVARRTTWDGIRRGGEYYIAYNVVATDDLSDPATIDRHAARVAAAVRDAPTFREVTPLVLRVIDVEYLDFWDVPAPGPVSVVGCLRVKLEMLAPA